MCILKSWIMSICNSSPTTRSNWCLLICNFIFSAIWSNPDTNLQGVSEKTAQSFATDKFWIICHRIASFAPKWPAKIPKGSPTFETSVGFRSWSRSAAVSLQVTEAINPALGCHYFSPGLRLPPQPPSSTAHWLVPNYTAWWLETYLFKELAQCSRRAAAGIRTRALVIASPTL